MPIVLVIDDDRSVHALITRFLEDIAEVETASTAEEGLRRVSAGGVDVVLLDIQLPDTNGLAVYCQIHEQDHRLPVIFITVEAGSETAIEAMKLGAYDYVSKPLERVSFRALVGRAIEAHKIVNTPVAISAEDNPDEHTEIFIGRSTPMLEIFKAIGRVASQPVTVLVRGQSGTGKELVARALVQHGDRSDKPFLAVNCAALPETLLESELFGHEKGAFTGADNKRIGKFEQANGGTLFLDEIGDMSPAVQAKVLRVLQEQRFQRVGGTKELSTDTRVIAATNRNLELMVEEGAFREDLVYRLNTVTIQLPLLKDRSEDIPLLLQYFLNRTCRDLGKDELEGISPEATEVLKAYAWPGNVRQLNAVVRWMVLNAPAPVITPAMLPPEILARTGQLPRPAAAPADAAASTEAGALAATAGAGTATEEEAAGAVRAIDLIALVDRLLEQGSTNVYAETLEQMERYVLSRVLEACGGNQTQAAEILGITRGKIRDRMATYDLKR